MTKHAALIAGEDSKPRCSWCVGDSEYVRYHDEEWGMPVVDDRLIFEKICLEGFQSGLSWLTILRKRPAFRIAFKNFDPELVTK
ncbi:MAG: DNA-3-methyladenine glycosylase I, partial [Ilumatobacteraceae bacterium]